MQCRSPWWTVHGQEGHAFTGNERHACTRTHSFSKLTTLDNLFCSVLFNDAAADRVCANMSDAEPPLAAEPALEEQDADEFADGGVDDVLRLLACSNVFAPVYLSRVEQCACTRALWGGAQWHERQLNCWTSAWPAA